MRSGGSVRPWRVGLRAGAVLVVSVGVVEDSLLEGLDLVVHLVGLDIRLELGEVVDSALAVGSCDDIVRVLPNILRNFTPGSFYSGDGVGEGAILKTSTH